MQCPRDTRCLKPAGHKGWCRVKGEREVPLEEDPHRGGTRGSARDGGGAAASKAARMQELGKRRGQQAARRAGDADDDDDDDWGRGDGDDGDGLEYEDFGMSRAERRAARGGGRRGAYAGEEDDSDEDAAADDWASGPAAPVASLESIRLARQRLETWQLEPFFDETVCNCVVRIGLGQAEAGGLYRLAEVVGVGEFADQPYTLGGRRSTKRLQLDFGECRRYFPMTSVSNQPFDALEMASFQQVREAAGAPPISQRQIDAKVAHLERASNYQYSEEDVRRKVQQELQHKAQRGELTTRQKMMAQHGGGGVLGPVGGMQPGARKAVAELAAPRKFQKDVFGRAVASDD